jgi:hypothetical protein
MLQLPELQRAFAAGVLEDATDVLAHLGDGRFGAARHLQVYRNNTFANLTDALAAIHPVVKKLVGEGFFAFAADRFIRRHPPRAGNLHEFGGEFAKFLSAFEPARSLPYLPDMARLEWLWHESFHDADAKPMALERLATVSDSQYRALRFTLHPAARLIESNYPILHIWQVNQDGYVGDDTVNLDEGGVRLLIHRPALEVLIAPLGAGEYALLSGFAAGATFASACEQVLAAEPGFDIGAALQRHIREGTIVSFTL